MPEQDNAQMTPLQNLFFYIRDLFDKSEHCYDFENETGNPKVEERNYWKVGGLLSLSKECEQREINEFSFPTKNTDRTENTDYVLKIKRIAIPSEPALPSALNDWAIIDRSTDIPNLTFKPQIETLEKFENSDKRVKDFEKYTKEAQTSLFEQVLPPSLEGWVNFVNNRAVSVAERNTFILFEADETRVNQAQQYDKDFIEYYAKYELPRKTNKVYDALHTLYYELKGGDNRRLYISFGLVSGEIGNENYHNFLFHVPLKINLKNQEIKIETDTFSGKIFCEQYFVKLFDLHFQAENPAAIEKRKEDVVRSIDEFNSKPKEFLFDKDFLRTEYYNSGLKILSVFADKHDIFFEGEELNYDFESTTPNNRISFSFSPIIQTKIVESQRDISKDANNIINKINELQNSDSLHLIPDFFKKLFAIDGLENINDLPTNRTPSPEGNRISTSDHRYLFPLPYNDEQEEIAKRLNEQDAVTVKGPPGTGKSHTIANLISHFVAHGKSILVVSQNVKALSVLKDKLPESIRELAVSFVNEGKGNEILKASVSAIINNLSQRYDKDELDTLEVQLSELKDKHSAILEKVYKTIKANSTTLKVFDPRDNGIKERTAHEWAISVDQNNFQPEYIQDEIFYSTETGGLAKNLSVLVEIASELKPDEFALVDYKFISDDNFLELNDLRNIEDKLLDIKEKINIQDYDSRVPEVITEKIIDEVSEIEQLFAEFGNFSIPKALFEHQNFDADKLKGLLEQNHAYIHQVKTATDKLLSYQLDLSAINDTDPDILYQQINQLILKFGESTSLGWLSKSILDKNLKRFFECKVNFIPVNDVEQLKVVEIEINKQKCLKQLSITFNNYLKIFDIPNQENIQGALKELELTLNFHEKLSALNRELRTKNIPQLSMRLTALPTGIKFLKNLRHYADYRRIISSLRGKKRQLISHDKPYPTINKIGDAIENVDRTAYEMYLDEYRKKREKQGKALEFEKIYRQVSAILPLTATAIKTTYHSGNPFILSEAVCEMDIFVLKVRKFLELITTETKGLEDLLSELHALKRGIENKTAEIVSYKAWQNKSNNVSDTQKTALNAWLSDLINIGKGYGKNYIRDWESAIKNMQIAKGAVPIWIMPQKTAVTFFPDASPNQFDLLIIDEASQCDISSLNLVFRCKKSLIVGDENQTSVVADKSIFTIERTNELLDKYLINHEFRTQFNVTNKNSSIYTISGILYPNIVMLREHFRCLPEIIGYSNKYVYNKEIIPLKTATEYKFGKPIGVHYVADNYNEEQKPLIVEKVVEEIEKYIHEYESGSLKKLPTIGILTLDSSNIKHQNLLIKQISQSDLIKRYADELEWAVGSSRKFQGDERDVMFLTVTASHSINERDFEIKPPRAATTEEFMRIFNVAASRAKERSVVIHSIHPDAVASMNPECYRKKLIDYYSSVQSTTTNGRVKPTLEELIGGCDPNSGEFEKSVCRLLYNNGFGEHIFPQLKVGKHRIDFGIIKNNKKLAIECDGVTFHSGMVNIKKDISRQLILERAGWRFFRIQSTDWFYRNETTSRALINWLGKNTA